MKSSASESVKGYLNLELLSREFRLWDGFDSDAEMLNYDNVFYKQFRFSVVLQAVLVQTELSSAN